MQECLVDLIHASFSLIKYFEFEFSSRNSTLKLSKEFNLWV
jgi:hypothetical protein